MGNRDLALYDGEKQVGRVSVERDHEGHIRAGKVLTYDPRKTNLIDFFDKTTAVVGLDLDDILDLQQIKEGFFIIEGYTPGTPQTVMCGYEPDPEKRAEMKKKFEHVKKNILGQRAEDFLKQSIDKLLGGS